MITPEQIQQWNKALQQLINDGMSAGVPINHIIMMFDIHHFGLLQISFDMQKPKIIPSGALPNGRG